VTHLVKSGAMLTFTGKVVFDTNKFNLVAMAGIGGCGSIDVQEMITQFCVRTHEQYRLDRLLTMVLGLVGFGSILYYRHLKKKEQKLK